MWLSISPGVTALPPRSIRLVFGPASRVISWLVPTATMRSPRIATACAIVKRSSTVMIFPFDRTRSAGPAEAAGEGPGAGCCARIIAPAPASASNAPTAAIFVVRRLMVSLNQWLMAYGLWLNTSLISAMSH